MIEKNVVLNKIHEIFSSKYKKDGHFTITLDQFDDAWNTICDELAEDFMKQELPQSAAEAIRWKS